ncbi:MAG: TolC family protein [Candidatus Aminicenantes bacterium]
MNIQPIRYVLLSIITLTFLMMGLGSNRLNANSADSLSLTKSSVKTISYQENTETFGRHLTFSQAIKQVLQKNPELLASNWEIKAKDGIIQQESLLPNPEIEIEMENFAGSAENKGFKQAETTVQVSQSIWLGGKRKKKMQAATLDKTLSYRDYDRKLAELMFETKVRFVETLYIQKKLELRKEMIELSETFSQQIAVRIEAGRTSPAELTRATVALLKNIMALKQLEKELSASKLRLAALWGSTKPDFERVEGELEIFSSLPKLDVLEVRLSQNPSLIRLSAEIDYRKSLLRLEKSFKIPDPTITGGFRRFNESGSTAFTFNVSIPIPILNRNQGSVKTAHYLLKKAESNHHALEIELANELKVRYEMLKITYDNAMMLKMSILPKALETFKIISNGYELGKFDYLNVLDALRTQLEVRQEYLQAISCYWNLMAGIEHLTGTDIKEIGFQKNKEGGNDE